MSEEKIVEVVNEALAAAGIEDTVIAAGEFNPRGHSGAGFAGGMIGGDIGDAIGSAADAIGTVGGYIVGTKAHDAASGLPERMVVGASETTVYGFAGNRAHPKARAFRVPREGLEAKVHQRVNVPVLELIDRGAAHASSSRACACRSRTRRTRSRSSPRPHPRIRSELASAGWRSASGARGVSRPVRALRPGSRRGRIRCLLEAEDLQQRSGVGV